MVGSRLVLAAILAAAVAACATSPSPWQPQAVDPPGSAPIANLPGGSSPVATTATPIAPSPTPTARSTKKPTPKPTPIPVPPKPTGVKLHEEEEAICGDDPADMCAIGDSTFTMSWKAPRTKRVQIRVYGVTACFGQDAGGKEIDGHCLREHTALPESVRVLLAKAPASKGKVTWRLGPGWERPDGATVYSIVVAAYNAAGEHSTFAIADAG